jgi:hypothetical protein
MPRRARLRLAGLPLRIMRTDPEAAVGDGTSIFAVPIDTPGLRVGKVFDKSGWRFYQNAELIFENARVPHDHLLGGQPYLVTARKRSGSSCRRDSVVERRLADTALRAKEESEGGRETSQRKNLITYHLSPTRCQEAPGSGTTSHVSSFVLLVHSGHSDSPGGSIVRSSKRSIGHPAQFWHACQMEFWLPRR